MGKSPTTEASQIQNARFEHLAKAWAIHPEALKELSLMFGTFNGSELAARISEGDLSPEKADEVAALNGAMTPGSTSGQDAGEIAVIPLRGTITPRGSFFSMLFGYGGGGLQAFRRRFATALADDNVKAIIIDIDSPGGVLDLVPETAADVRNARGKKPIIAIANTMAASAAYWIGSQADELVVTPSGQVGSIGVFVLHEDVSARAEALGVKINIIRAGRFKAEANPYEPLSKAAQQFMQSRVDEMYALFTNDVAKGRKTTAQIVEAAYGEGRCFLAQQALAMKMVDRIETFEELAARLGADAEDPDATDPDEVEDDCDDDVEDDDDMEGSEDVPADAPEVAADEREPAPAADEPAPDEGGDEDEASSATAKAAQPPARLYGLDPAEDKPAWSL